MRGYVIEKMSLGELPRWYVLNEQPPRQPVAGPFDTEEAAQAEALRLETLRGAVEDMLAALKVAEKYISAAQERGSPSEKTLSVIRAANRKAEGRGRKCHR